MKSAAQVNRERTELRAMEILEGGNITALEKSLTEDIKLKTLEDKVLGLENSLSYLIYLQEAQGSKSWRDKLSGLWLNLKLKIINLLDT